MRFLLKQSKKCAGIIRKRQETQVNSACGGLGGRAASGARAEQIAADYLMERGFRIVERNVRYRRGEIDIVARRDDELHFVEVRSRGARSPITPFETVTERKRKRIRIAAQCYLTQHRKSFNGNDLPPCYYDVIGIVFAADEVQIECLLDAFR